MGDLCSHLDMHVSAPNGIIAEIVPLTGHPQEDITDSWSSTKNFSEDPPSYKEAF